MFKRSSTPVKFDPGAETGILESILLRLKLVNHAVRIHSPLRQRFSFTTRRKRETELLHEATDLVHPMVLVFLHKWGGDLIAHKKCRRQDMVVERSILAI